MFKHAHGPFRLDDTFDIHACTFIFQSIHVWIKVYDLAQINVGVKKILYFLFEQKHTYKNHCESKHIQPIVNMWLLEPHVGRNIFFFFFLVQYKNICEFSQPMWRYLELNFTNWRDISLRKLVTIVFVN
jgi:hypothetical protein